MASSATRRVPRALFGVSSWTSCQTDRTCTRLASRPRQFAAATGQLGFSHRLLSYDSALRPIATQMGSASNAEIQLSPPRIKLSRLMEMEDCQMFGVVHGCTQLQLVEDAGITLTTKYCNHFRTSPDLEVTTLTACLERANFLKPMLVGDIAEVEAEITYTTARSLQVTANVYAKNQDDGSRYKTAEAKFWFVAKTIGDQPETAPVSPLRNEDGTLIQRPELEAGYQALAQLRNKLRPYLFNRPYRPEIVKYYAPADEIEPLTVDFSRHNFSLPIQPNHAVPGENYCRSAVLLRLMDEVGAYVAGAHTYYYAFTSSMDSVLFHRKVDAGNVLVCHAKAIFTSSKILEIAVRAERQEVIPGIRPKTARVADGILTFMCVDTNTGRTRDIPPLKLITAEEKKLFEARKLVYEQGKLARQLQQTTATVK